MSQWSQFTPEWAKAQNAKRAPHGVSTRGKQPDKAQDIKRGIASPASRQTANTGCIYLPVTPVAKPRMTRRDKWAQRPAVIRYRDYCDAVRAAWGARPFPAAGAWLVFHLPMPRSWSRKKKDAMRGTIHQQKPDKDNLEKAWNDALHSDDSHIADSRITKLWADVGYIEIYLDALPSVESLINKQAA